MTQEYDEEGQDDGRQRVDKRPCLQDDRQNDRRHEWGEAGAGIHIDDLRGRERDADLHIERQGQEPDDGDAHAGADTDEYENPAAVRHPGSARRKEIAGCDGCDFGEDDLALSQSFRGGDHQQDDENGERRRQCPGKELWFVFICSEHTISFQHRLSCMNIPLVVDMELLLILEYY